MREEISEPQPWRSSPSSNAAEKKFWSVHHPQRDLPAELVDAALEQDTSSARPAQTPGHTGFPQQADIIKSLSDQLTLLEEQRLQLQQLLDDAQGGSPAG